MRKLSTLLFILSLSLAPHLAHAAETSELSPLNECSFQWISPAEQDELVAQAVADFKSQQSAYGKMLISLYSKKIEKAVLKSCQEDKGCQREHVQQVVVQQTMLTFGKWRKTRGYAILIGLSGATMWGSQILSHWAGNDPMIANLIGQQVGRLIGYWQAPIMNPIDQKMTQLTYSIASDGTSATAKTNKGFSKINENAIVSLDGRSRDGRTSLTNAMAEIKDNFQALRMAYQDNYSATSPTAGSLSDDDFARLLAVSLFHMRIYRSEIAPSNPQALSLLLPTVRPLAPLFLQLEGKVWGALDELELMEARVQGESDYDRETAESFYNQLTFEWFIKKLPELQERKGLVNRAPLQIN